jgi:hypothetical protein
MNLDRKGCRTAVGILLLLALAGCQPIAKQQAKSPAIQPQAVPAAAVQHAPTLTDLTAGQLGIGGGFLIGADPRNVREHVTAQAIAAAEKAEQSPTPIQLVHESETADLNHDGYVTLDEVLAMVRSGLSDKEIGDRLRATHYLFEITPQQERYLTDRGVSLEVVKTIREFSSGSVGNK